MAEYDLVVIGGGPAGYAAALACAPAGKSVLLVDLAAPGGTCLHRGCVPAKTLLAAAARWRQARAGAEVGLPALTAPGDFGVVRRRWEKAVADLGTGLQRQLQAAKIEVRRGGARLAGPGEVVIDGSEPVRGRAVLIATGSAPVVPPGLTLAAGKIITSDGVWALDRVPPRLLIVGGGVIGCEFATAFADLGSAVTLIEAQPRLLPGMDDDLAATLARAFRKQGMTVLTGATVTGAAVAGDTVTAELAVTGKTTAWTGELILVAVGRRPEAGTAGDLAGLGVQRAPGGGLAVNDRLATGCPGLYAAGDVIGGKLLAHAASAQGELVAANLLGGQERYDDALIPAAVYTHPEIGCVGLTETAARAAGLDVVTGSVPARALARAHTAGELDGLCKLVAERGSGRLVGIHLCGEHAAELLAAAVCAISQKMTVHEVGHVVQAHPTMSEGLVLAARTITAGR